MFFHRNDPDEFIGEMPANDEYEDDEYYGDEEEYAEDGEYDEEDYEEEDEEDEAPGGAPKRDWVKTALMGTGAILTLGLGTYAALNFFAPDVTNELVNNLPFVSQGDQGADPAAEMAGEAPPPVDGEVAPPPPVEGEGDMAAVPPPPAKAKPPEESAEAPPPAEAPKTVRKPKVPPVEQTPAPTPTMPEPAPAEMAAVSAPRAAAPKPAAKPKISAWRARQNWLAKQAAAKRAAAARAAAARKRYARYYQAKPAASRYQARVAAQRAAAARRYRAAQAAKRKRSAYVAPRGGRYAVQVGSFSNPANASQLAARLRARGIPAWVSGGSGATASSGGYMVRSVAVKQRSNVDRLVAQYRASGYPAKVIQLGNGYMAAQIGNYGTRGRAQGVVDALNRHGMFASIHHTGAAPTYRSTGLSRVYVGTFANHYQAASKMRQIQAMGIPAAVARF